MVSGRAQSAQLLRGGTVHIDGPVVIALDGSTHSAKTLAWGLAEATLRGADVVLARVYRLPRSLVEWSWYPIVGEGLALDTEAKAYLAETLERESELHPDLTIRTLLLNGPEVPELRRLSEQAQLLVVGARCQDGRARIGSITAHLAAHARCPVAVVRARADADPDRSPVVVGVDGSPSSLDAARTAAREAALREAALVVVHARPTIADPYGQSLPELAPPSGSDVDPDDPTHRAARSVARLLRTENVGLDVRLTLVDDDPAHALVGAARDAQLLVVGSRGLGAFTGMLLGSVSTDVVRHATTAVLVVHNSLTE